MHNWPENDSNDEKQDTFNCDQPPFVSKAGKLRWFFSRTVIIIFCFNAMHRYETEFIFIISERYSFQNVRLETIRSFIKINLLSNSVTINVLWNTKLTNCWSYSASTSKFLLQKIHSFWLIYLNILGTETKAQYLTTKYLLVDKLKLVNQKKIIGWEYSENDPLGRNAILFRHCRNLSDIASATPNKWKIGWMNKFLI